MADCESPTSLNAPELIETLGDTDLQVEEPLESPKAVKDKIEILLKHTGNAPIMKKKKWSVERDKKIGAIIEFCKKYLKIDPSESLFIYVNQSFAPSPDQIIENLYNCYGTDGKLILHYCISQAWG
uniref:Ubiquitin-like protein ATG12 n=1 Tax=Clastoptera arizonana TaxID=38151 RepID=A0A1B6EEV5_9HEMI